MFIHSGKTDLWELFIVNRIIYYYLNIQFKFEYE